MHILNIENTMKNDGEGFKTIYIWKLLKHIGFTKKDSYHLLQKLKK